MAASTKAKVNSSSKFFLFIFGLMFIAGGITAGVLIDKSSVLNPDKPKADGAFSCGGSIACPGTQQSCCVGSGTSCNPGATPAPGEPGCLTSQAGNLPRWTCCAVGYDCVNNGCVKPGVIDCTGTPQCPSGSTMVCGAVTPHTYCGISKCDCLSNHFPAQFKFKEDSCYDYDNDLINSTCNTNCKCQPNVTITPTKPPQQCINGPVDVILTLDRSGSMGPIKLGYAKNAALAFVNLFNAQGATFKANVRVGVVTWAGQWRNVKSLAPTTNYASVTSFINGITNISGDDLTCIECGLAKAGSMLTDASKRRIIVLMSDGIGNRIIESYNCGSGGTSFCGNPEPPTCQARFSATAGLHCAMADTKAIVTADVQTRLGKTIYAIGYGSKTAPSILESTLQKIAGNKYIYGGTETNWTNVFLNIAKTICPDAGTVGGGIVTPTASPNSSAITSITTTTTSLTVNFNNPDARIADLIRLFNSSSDPINKFVDWKYTNGTRGGVQPTTILKSGSLTFANLQPGKYYHVRYTNGPQTIDSQGVTLPGTAQWPILSSSYQSAGTLYINFSRSDATVNDKIVVTRFASDPITTPFNWKYLNNGQILPSVPKTSGQVTISSAGETRVWTARYVRGTTVIGTRYIGY